MVSDTVGFKPDPRTGSKYGSGNKVTHTVEEPSAKTPGQTINKTRSKPATYNQTQVQTHHQILHKV